LAIIDLSDTGKQPMFYGGGRYAITYNGEIYNYLELREQLERAGHQFVSSSDTEVLLALYAEKKEKCLDDLDGMFSFAIWDETAAKLFVARDRFGEKPFYYAFHDGAFYFASEMKALWAAGVRRDVSGKMLFNYLENNFTYNPRDLSETFYEGIFKLKAAHCFVISPDNLQVVDQVRYWNIDHTATDPRITEQEASEEFRRMFELSVTRRLRADVPVGSSLSGGLDSSLIVCTIDRLERDKPVRQATFSARFPGFAKDEGQFIKAVTDTTDVEPHFVVPDEKGLVEDLESLFHHQEEPFGSASIYAQFCVMRLAKENNVTVLLDGQGADELLAGYHSYFEEYLRELRHADPALWRSELRAYTRSQIRKNGGLSLNALAKGFLPGQLKDKAREIRDHVRKHTRSFLSTDFYRENSSAAFPRALPSGSLQESLARHATGGALEELLRYVDRNSMAHSREVRLPFLYHRLAEFLFSLPPGFKIRGGVTKYILRESFRDVLPEAIVNRTDKIGYEPPQGSWLKNPRVVEMVRDSTQALADREIVTRRVGSGKIADDDALKWKLLMAGSLFKR
jgi:asparagine synthase (glutamine-hydrolysing)